MSNTQAIIDFVEGRSPGISLEGRASNRAVQWKVLPWPDSPSTQIRPPIRFTSLEQMETPTPVPPNSPVVGLEEWFEDDPWTLFRDGEDARPRQITFRLVQGESDRESHDPPAQDEGEADMGIRLARITR